MINYCVFDAGYSCMSCTWIHTYTKIYGSVLRVMLYVGNVYACRSCDQLLRVGFTLFDLFPDITDRISSI